MHRRDVLKIKAIRSNEQSDWRAFKICSNNVNNEIKLAKQRYYNEAFNDAEAIRAIPGE